MYLPLAAGKETMLELKRYVKRFRLSFDYLNRIGDRQANRRLEPDGARRELRSDGRAVGPGSTTCTGWRAKWGCASSRTSR